MADELTKRLAADLVEALAPLNARSRAMFGGYCFYVDDVVAGLVCDGAVFVKRSPDDDMLAAFASAGAGVSGGQGHLAAVRRRRARGARAGS